jgi:DNA-binding NarL/FixJ family response regulator
MESPTRIRVLIAEDDEGVRETLASVVRSESALELAATAEDADQAIRAAARELPDVALVDVRMPGGGAAATRGIKRRSPHTRVLAFSAHDDPLTVQEMVAAGADGYVVKGSPVPAIIASIRLAVSGSSAVPEQRAA